jgi:acyl dehydratase
MYYEEFQPGDLFFSAGRTITEGDITAFAGLSGDFNQKHTNAEFAAGTIYMKRVAHGILGLSVVSGLAARMGFSEGTAVALRKIDWKFISPLYIGDTIKTVFKVKRKKDIPGEGAGLIEFQIEVFNQQDAKIQTGRWHMLIKKNEK